MKTEPNNPSLSSNLILNLIRQLPKNQKIKLVKELEKETIDAKLTKLLATFRTDELDLDIIDQEVELVRTDIYNQSQQNQGNI